MTNITEISPYLERESKRLGIIGSKREVLHHDYHFQRQQSNAMRDLAWETRADKVESWGGGILCALALIVFCVSAFIIAAGVVQGLEQQGIVRARQ